MKNLKLFLLLAGIMLLSASIHSTPAVQGEEGATVVFYRDKMMLKQYSFAVAHVSKDEIIVFLKYKTYFRYRTTELGSLPLIGGVGRNLSAGMNLTLEKGKTYYVRCWFEETGFLKHTAFFELVDESVALPVIQKYKEMKTKHT